ncbi:metallophosphoesterase [Paenibacillus sp. YIM B09110]|uniref:metallophosphoesterase n=1 Tax=Paenibacillus sp. YIM B09110 TaxID=3126102 RepID=UPI00301C35A2
MFITGDIHGYFDIGKLNSRRFPLGRSLTKSDYVLIAGDFGLVWDNKKDELFWRKWLSKKCFTTLFIDGNHENHELLDSYPIEIWNGGKIHRINDSIIHLMRGQVFNLNGKKVFTFGGAASHDKPYRKENVSWWPRELPSHEEYMEGLLNLERNQWKVDLVVTHTCPSSTINELQDIVSYPIEVDELHMYLEKIKLQLSYNNWFFGHFHNDRKLSNDLTLLYNKMVEI